MGAIVETVVAVLASILAAGLTVIFVVIASMPLGGVGHKIGLLTDEGAAWFGLSFGIPVGIVCACFVFVYCFRKIKSRLR